MTVELGIKLFEVSFSESVLGVSFTSSSPRKGPRIFQM